MSKKTILTTSNDMDKYLIEQAELLGMTKIDYIRFILNKDMEKTKNEHSL
jgi:hypothetical protein